VGWAGLAIEWLSRKCHGQFSNEFVDRNPQGIGELFVPFDIKHPTLNVIL
jgi:hypothetical protein